MVPKQSPRVKITAAAEIPHANGIIARNKMQIKAIFFIDFRFLYPFSIKMKLESAWAVTVIGRLLSLIIQFSTLDYKF